VVSEATVVSTDFLEPQLAKSNAVEAKPTIRSVRGEKRRIDDLSKEFPTS
jgi:hypothetical protein